MARGIAKIVAVPRRLSLGCQRQSLHFSRRRAKKGRRADAGVSNQFTANSQAQAVCFNVRASVAKFQLAALIAEINTARTNARKSQGPALERPTNPRVRIASRICSDGFGIS